MEVERHPTPVASEAQLRTLQPPPAISTLQQQWLAERQAPLRAAYSIMLDAPPAPVFAFISDPQQMCRFVPELQQVELEGVDPTAVGVLRTCHYSNDMQLQERISLSCAPWLLGLDTLVPNPFGLEQHAALISCAPTRRGTHLWWVHTFDHADPPAMLRLFDQTFAAILNFLRQRFGGQPPLRIH